MIHPAALDADTLEQSSARGDYPDQYRKEHREPFGAVPPAIPLDMCHRVAPRCDKLPTNAEIARGEKFVDGHGQTPLVRAPTRPVFQYPIAHRIPLVC